MSTVAQKVTTVVASSKSDAQRKTLCKEIEILEETLRYIYDCLWETNDQIIKDYMAIKLAMLEQMKLDILEPQKDEVTTRGKRFLEGNLSQEELRRWLELTLGDMKEAGKLLKET